LQVTSVRRPVIKLRRPRKPEVNGHFIPDTIPAAERSQRCGMFVDGLSCQWLGRKVENFRRRQGLHYMKVVKRKRSSSAKVYFDNLTDRHIAYELPSRTEVDGCPLFVTRLQTGGYF
jgi:hypothetical protein